MVSLLAGISVNIFCFYFTHTKWCKWFILYLSECKWNLFTIYMF